MLASANEVLDVEMSGAGTSWRTRLDQGLHFVVSWSPLPTAVSGALAVLTGLVALSALASFWLGAWREPSLAQAGTIRSRLPDEPVIAAG